MTKGSLSRTNEKNTIKRRHNPFEGPFLELSEFDYADSLNSLEKDKHAPSTSDPGYLESLSTIDLITAVNYVWNHAFRPISVLPKTDPTGKPEIHQRCDSLSYYNEEQNFHTSNSVYGHRKTNSVKAEHDNLVVSKVNQKILPCYESYSFWKLLQSRSTMIHSSSTKNCLPTAVITPNLKSIYGWMGAIDLGKPKNRLNSVRNDNQITYTRPVIGLSNLATDSLRSDITCSSNNLRISGCDPEAMECVDLSHSKVAYFDSKASTVCSRNAITHAQDVEATDLKIITLRSGLNSHEPNLAPGIHEINVEKAVDDMHEYALDHGTTHIKTDFSEIRTNLSGKEKPHQSIAKQEHAVAGAMAGIFVSLCLHPMDTIKTVIQSCHADKKSLHFIGRSIISERGVAGLYRGISSNIVSSAPISAIYMFTYESVKKTLLPLFPKEYHSLAHCMAGGCASVATSFIFTPSEHIKQQMQVCTHYRNSWTALIEVVRKGGLISLYAGWRAVLCRNVPHSVIKFYTYESLKEHMLPSVQSCAQPNILVTLVCGGLAGSVASLFTTPFDVVKTRLQTQSPGSFTGYNGVFNTLTAVGKHEGLKGLYRGLTPRLIMYMIQGALFFASYESFKSLFSLEIPQLRAQATHHEQRIEDDSTTLHSLISVSA